MVSLLQIKKRQIRDRFVDGDVPRFTAFVPPVYPPLPSPRVPVTLRPNVPSVRLVQALHEYFLFSEAIALRFGVCTLLLVAVLCSNGLVQLYRHLCTAEENEVRDGGKDEEREAWSSDNALCIMIVSQIAPVDIITACCRICASLTSPRQDTLMGCAPSGERHTQQDSRFDLIGTGLCRR